MLTDITWLRTMNASTSISVSETVYHVQLVKLVLIKMGPIIVNVRCIHLFNCIVTMNFEFWLVWLLRTNPKSLHFIIWQWVRHLSYQGGLIIIYDLSFQIPYLLRSTPKTLMILKSTVSSLDVTTLNGRWHSFLNFALPLISNLTGLYSRGIWFALSINLSQCFNIRQQCYWFCSEFFFTLFFANLIKSFL